MNLLNNGPYDSLLSDGVKPQPDPMLTSHDINMLLCDSSRYKHVDDDNKFEWIIFKMSPVKRSIGKGPACANFTDTHRRQFYWIYTGYFHLKFKHVNKSHISFKGFIVNKSWRLLQMPWFLVSPPQCLTPRAPCAIFAPLTAGQAKESFC